MEQTAEQKLAEFVHENIARMTPPQLAAWKKKSQKIMDNSAAEWCKPKSARLFHRFKDGKSLCGAWSITRPVHRAKAGVSITELCGACRQSAASRIESKEASK